MNQSSSEGRSMSLSPPDRQRVDEQITTAIVDAILDGAFPAGSTLPPERELADQLAVNRTSLRQALARLQQMGLIEARHGSGNVVADPAGLTHPIVVEALLHRLGPDFLTEVLEVRTAFGELIGRLAAERVHPAAVAALTEALTTVRAAATAEDRQQADMAFFAVLIGGTGNRALGLLYRWVEQAFGGQHRLTAGYTDAAAVTAGLAAITDAVCAGNPAAAAAAVDGYLRDSARRIAAADTGRRGRG